MEQTGPTGVGEAPSAATMAAMPQGLDLELACELVSALVGDASRVGGGDGDRKRAGGYSGGSRIRRAVSASCTESARVSLQQLVHFLTHTHAVKCTTAPVEVRCPEHSTLPRGWLDLRTFRVIWRS